MNLLKTIIVDDEPDSIELLKIELAAHCPQVAVAGTYTNSTKAVNDIEKLQPDLLFLDIEMPGMNGFELLEKILHLNFSIIFITAYNQYALKAFRFNALDYLVKPIDSIDLIEAVAKAEKKMKPTAAQLNLVQRQLRGELPNKIAIQGNNGITFIELNEIVYVEASNNYSRLLLTDKKLFTISKTLKDVQEVLEESHFLRVHRQYIINLNRVKQFNRNEGILTMDNGDHIPVARNQKERLVEKYGWL
ncbi:MAG: LytTR family DNA-binding domain-containing protein [Ferruginibacter sp.]|nr:response regulator transcription factor [Chitinophagaceae bacterium]